VVQPIWPMTRSISVRKDVDRLFDAGQTARCRAIKCRAPHDDKIGTEAQRYQDVGAAPHSAVKHDSCAVADRCVDRRKRASSEAGAWSSWRPPWFDT